MADQILIPAGGSLVSPQVLDSITAGGKEQQRVRLLDPSGNPIDSQLVGSTRTMSVSPVDVSASGTITALNGTVTLATAGMSSLTLYMSGTWVGGVQFEATTNGTNWEPVPVIFSNTVGTILTGITVNLICVRTNVAGYQQFRVRATAWTSGTLSLDIRASLADFGTALLAPLPTGPNYIGRTRQTDGTNDLTLVAKGTQGAFAVPTHSLTDSGRQAVTLVWERVGTGTSESALANFTSGVRAATALSAANNYQVQAGKTLRITHVNATIFSGTTSPAAFNSRIRIRQAASVANTSPIIWQAEVTMFPGTAAAMVGNHENYPIPEGLEVAAGQQITMTHIESATGGAGSPPAGVTVVIYGYEY